MLKTKTLYSLRDISTLPERTTAIESRKECDVYVENIEKSGLSRLPLIVSPMSCVLDENKWREFHKERINAIIPRTVNFDTRLRLSETVMCAFSLSEARSILLMPINGIRKFNLCLDMANGHMLAQINVGKSLKDRFGDSLSLMGGNIANPETYAEYAKAGFDFVRIGIGGGSGCLSATQLGIYYPMASLINDMVEVRRKLDPVIPGKCKIVADGGISCYSEIIKCLALGADYVMMGKVFSQAALEGENVGDEVEYFGMSTKKAQILMGAEAGKLKTSEGKFLRLKKEYTLQGWTENMIDYLRSAMSYVNSRTIKEFSEKAVCQVISPNSAAKINDK